jgi:DNA-binding NarL/FixJ family response regulator
MARNQSNPTPALQNPSHHDGAADPSTAPPAADRPVKPIRIVMVEDEKILAQVMGVWLEKGLDFHIEGYATTPQAGWELCLAKRPDLILTDVGMPGGDGLLLAKRVRDELPEIRVIILTGRVNPYTTWRASQIGVHGLIDKSSDMMSLHEAIITVMKGGEFVSPSFQQIREGQLAESEAFHKVLSDRELEVLFSVTEGLGDPEIGTQLGISPDTVACHRKNIRKKLELHDDRSLIAYGRKWGTFGGGRSTGK